MFTIKQIIKDPDNSSRTLIRLWEGSNVHTSYNAAYEKAELHFDMTDGVLCSIDVGVVYVMNAAGKTVETVRLAGSEFI